MGDGLGGANRPDLDVFGVDDQLVGSGTADMKGGAVVMLLALKALKDGGMLDQLQITAVFTGDEDTNLYRGFLGRRFGHGEAVQAGFQQYGTSGVPSGGWVQYVRRTSSIESSPTIRRPASFT